jgi:hypothetical protein
MRVCHRTSSYLPIPVGTLINCSAVAEDMSNITDPQEEAVLGDSSAGKGKRARRSSTAKKVNSEPFATTLLSVRRPEQGMGSLPDSSRQSAQTQSHQRSSFLAYVERILRSTLTRTQARRIMQATHSGIPDPLEGLVDTDKALSRVVKVSSCGRGGALVRLCDYRMARKAAKERQRKPRI